MAPVISFDYDFSPYGQKLKLLLTSAGIQYSKFDVPPVLPRSDLEALGITYRRIPLLAIGRDVYADTALIIDTILAKLGQVQQTPADKAFEAWGEVTFQELLELAPAKLLSPDFVKDREAIFPLLARPDFAQLRPSGIASFKARCREVEDLFLANSSGPFIGGSTIALADIHVIFGLRWCLNDLGAKDEPGLGPDAFPKLWRLINSLPPTNPAVLTQAEMMEAITTSEYTAPDLGVAKDDPLGLTAGTRVNIESFDAKPGSYPQHGTLVGASPAEVVIEVKHGVRLHFPRVAYIVKPL